MKQPLIHSPFDHLISNDRAQNHGIVVRLRNMSSRKGLGLRSYDILMID